MPGGFGTVTKMSFTCVRGLEHRCQCTHAIVDRYSFPAVPIQAVLDEVGIGTIVVGKWNGVLENF